MMLTYKSTFQPNLPVYCWNKTAYVWNAAMADKILKVIWDVYRLLRSDFIESFWAFIQRPIQIPDHRKTTIQCRSFVDKISCCYVYFLLDNIICDNSDRFDLLGVFDKEIKKVYMRTFIN